MWHVLRVVAEFAAAIVLIVWANMLRQHEYQRRAEDKVRVRTVSRERE